MSMLVGKNQLPLGSPVTGITPAKAADHKDRFTRRQWRSAACCRESLQQMDRQR